MKLTDLPPVFDTNVQPLKPEDVARIIRDLDKEAAKTGYENKWAKPYGMRDLSGEFPGMSPQMARLLASRGQSAQTHSQLSAESGLYGVAAIAWPHERHVSVMMDGARATSGNTNSI